ncbi:hypothetical protein FTW19_12510 [Terriglobus albidus]|uniref:Uncharacterized protein n=1 Tax=Terriglobus albidus TaxID=1592106 RepID=A0A5B9E9F3_9BACT|nr:hypothetical protein FTW19_12510 [Terriglobus albidus]
MCAQRGVVVVTSVVIICAVLASLAAGVLLAYGICQALFAIFRVHARSVAATRVSAAPARTIAG